MAPDRMAALLIAHAWDEHGRPMLAVALTMPSHIEQQNMGYPLGAFDYISAGRSDLDLPSQVSLDWVLRQLYPCLDRPGAFVVRTVH